MFGLKKKNRLDDGFKKDIEKVTHMLENASDTDFDATYEYYKQSLKDAETDYEFIMKSALENYAEKSLEMLRQSEDEGILSEIVDVKMRFYNLTLVSEDSKWSEYFDYCNKLIRKLNNM